MTPFNCAVEIADFLKGVLDVGNGQIYAGFLPKIDKVKDANKRCPAIAVRAVQVEDNKEHSTVDIAIYILTYDDDMKFGSESLYHIIEKIRYELLTNNPINDRWLIDLKDNSFIEDIPDEQPYPFYWSAIQFTVKIPQPSNKKVINLMTR